MPGTASAPAQGTYGFPYIKLGTDFSVAGSFTIPQLEESATTYYSRGAGNAVDTTGPAVAQTDSLKNFDENTMRHLVIWALQLLVELWTASSPIQLLQEAISGDTADGSTCTRVTRLVAVMNLAAPFTVTSQTYAVNFNFILTNYGGQFIDGNDAGIVPDEFASAPFAGYFTVLNAD